MKKSKTYSQPPPVQNVKILIVDDNPDQLVALEAILEKEGREFIKAPDGKTALKEALSNKLSLIILDVEMPNMSGFDVAEILKANKKTGNVPIIFVSAHKKDPVAILKGYSEGGAVDYLIKPLNPDITRAKVEVFLTLAKQGFLPNNTDSQPMVGDGQIFVKSGSKFIKIKYEDILYFEAKGDYVLIHTLTENIIFLSSMRELEAKLPTKFFVRVHRSYIVNASHISSIQDYVLQVHGHLIVIGKSYRQIIHDLLPKL